MATYDYSDVRLVTSESNANILYPLSRVTPELRALHSILVRGVEYLDLENKFNAVLDSAECLSQKQSLIEEIIVLAFYTRDIRNGKGERLVSEYLFQCLLKSNHTRLLTLSLLHLVPEYGSWRDLFSLGTLYTGTTLVDIVEAQFIKDEQALSTGRPISLLAKWMPREGHRDVVAFVVRLVPGVMFWPTRMKLYRKRLARLNRAINTVEINMCANKWDLIDPAKVPVRAMNKYSKAFLNETNTKRNGEYYVKGPRHPDSLVRNLCRENFQEYFINKPEKNLPPKSNNESYASVRCAVKAFFLATRNDDDSIPFAYA
jgi:hypothetical protein